MPGCSRASLGLSGTRATRRDATSRGSPLFCRGGSPLECRVDRRPFNARTSRASSRAGTLCKASRLVRSGWFPRLKAQSAAVHIASTKGTSKRQDRHPSTESRRRFSLPLSAFCRVSNFDDRQNTKRRRLHSRRFPVNVVPLERQRSVQWDGAFVDPTRNGNCSVPCLSNRYRPRSADVRRPNITGEFELNNNQGSSSLGSTSGPFAHGSRVNYFPMGDPGTAYKISFDASRASGTYGDSSTVQPPALMVLPCIKI